MAGGVCIAGPSDTYCGLPLLRLASIVIYPFATYPLIDCCPKPNIQEKGGPRDA